MFDFINQALSEQGVNPLNSKTSNRTSKKSVVRESAQPSTKIKESSLSFSELENLFEGAIKETSNNIIMSSMVLEDSQKLEQTNAINRTKINENFTETFLNETVAPVISICGTLTEDARLLHTINDPARVRGVSLPVYEVAMTLESARRGALTEDSMNYDIPVKEDVDPTILDLRAASAEANAKDGLVDEDEQKLADLIDDDEGTNYDMGEQGVTESYDIDDVHQYEDNDDLMYELEKGTEPNQDGMFEDEPDYDNVSDIEEYEGEVGGEEFPDEVGPMIKEGSALARFLFSTNENCDPEVDYDDESDIEEYEGEVAGIGDDEEYDDDEFAGDGSADEAIIGEQQTFIAKNILGQIFKEYGITSPLKQKAIVREAIHYLFRYGSVNLFPVASDVATLVVEQNNISEIDGHWSAATIVEATTPVLTALQEADIEDKSNEYLNALATSKEMTKDNEKMSEEDEENGCPVNGIEENAVMKAVNFITTTSLVERTRQAFRCRMHHFSEEVKNSVANNWVLVENNSDEIANSMKDEITVRRFVTETTDMKKYFSVLGESSPVYKPSWKKAAINNDALTSACLFTEVVTQWTKLKDSMYSGASLEEKYVALQAMFHLHAIYENLCTGMGDSSKIKQLISNHAFRLQNLQEKVELAYQNQQH
jgi:hypothetical protein